MIKVARFKGLCCANCAVKLENALRRIDGVKGIQLNFMAQRITFNIEDEKIDNVIEEIKKITKKLEPDMEYKGI